MPGQVIVHTCYMCDARATGQEHVPPLGFFPKGRRERLITVPSCDLHNSKKSKEDEYLRAVFTATRGVNRIAAKIAEGPVLRSIARRPHIGRTLFNNARQHEHVVDAPASFQVDVLRFNKAVGHIVRALYFHHTGRKLTAELNVAWGALHEIDLRPTDIDHVIRRAEISAPPTYASEHPEVYKFAFHLDLPNGSKLCRLRFYDGEPVFVSWLE